MQETRPLDLTEEEAKRQGKLRREYFLAQTENAVTTKMDSRLRELKGETLVRRQKIGRNEPCPCGSGLKFKKCCIHSARV
jgi:uncharacterized protein YecA (UPF0149 family)